MNTEQLNAEQLAQLDAEITRQLNRRQLYLYKPYPKQIEFHNATALIPESIVSERLLMAGNQLGKTLSAGAETAMHLTGEYPVWFRGRKFREPVQAWAGGKNGQSVRDTVQRILLGQVNEIGTGMIPGNKIVDYKKAVHGVADQIETVFVRHVTGGTSRLTLKTYDQGRERWQGETLHFVWFDEEPDLDIYSEGKTRVQVKKGMVFLTFTPLLGMSNVVVRFLQEKPPGSIVVQMTINDVTHYSEEQKAAIIAGYPEHERRSRAMGMPIMGSGQVFPIDETIIKEPPIQIPAFWPRIGALDIGGYDHPTAVVWIAWDRDADIVHLYDAYRQAKQPIAVHASAIKSRGAWIPIAWPHDAHSHDKGSGQIIAAQYRKEGVNMMLRHATHKPKQGEKEGSGGFSTEAGVSELLERMQTGRFKVNSNLIDWFDEFRMYHRKDGLIVKERDDLMSATRIGHMMLRFAKIYEAPRRHGMVPSFQSSDPTMGVLG